MKLGGFIKNELSKKDLLTVNFFDSRHADFSTLVEDANIEREILDMDISSSRIECSLNKFAVVYI